MSTSASLFRGYTVLAYNKAIYASNSENYDIMTPPKLDTKTTYESLDNVNAVYSADEADGRIHSCLGCNNDIEEGQMMTIERLRVTLADKHEKPYISPAYWHQSCYDAASET